jgi:hypothetical protein
LLELFWVVASLELENKKTAINSNAAPVQIRELILRGMGIISSVRNSLAPIGISVSALLLTGKMRPTTYEAEFPIRDLRSRILPPSCPGHNEFAECAEFPADLGNQCGES